MTNELPQSIPPLNLQEYLDGITFPGEIDLYDEGVSQGTVNKINFIGTKISATKQTIDGDGRGLVVTKQENPISGTGTVPAAYWYSEGTFTSVEDLESATGTVLTHTEISSSNLYFTTGTSNTRITVPHLDSTTGTSGLYYIELYVEGDTTSSICIDTGVDADDNEEIVFVYGGGGKIFQNGVYQNTGAGGLGWKIMKANCHVSTKMISIQRGIVEIDDNQSVQAYVNVLKSNTQATSQSKIPSTSGSFKFTIQRVSLYYVEP